MSPRGSATIETTIVLAALLTFLLGTIQVGVVGFLQLTVDAGSFLNAHQYVTGVKNSVSAADATNKVFSQIKQSEIAAPVVAPAPTPSVYVDYGYNSSSASVVNASSSNRHGGASILQPYLASSTIVKQPFNILGFKVNVQSTATEPLWFESAPEWDIANRTYGGTSTSSLYRANPYTQGTNTPPYFIAQAFLVHCNGNQVFDQYCNSSDFLALGLGNNLDAFNEKNPSPGVSGLASGSTAGTFQAMACHQRQYAKIAMFLQSEPNLSVQNQHYNMATVNNGIANFNSWLGYAAEKSPYVASAAQHQVAQDANAAVRAVYSWDIEHGSNPPANFQPGQNPLTPSLGC